MLAFILNTDHYANVLSRVSTVKHTLWIGTADIKDLYVDIGKEKKPFLALIAQLIKRDVDVLSFGNLVEVLESKTLREDISIIVRTLAKRYRQ